MPGTAPRRDARDGARPVTLRPLRLLIVDDSIVARSILARAIAGRNEFEVVGTASGVAQALALLDKTSVDIVLLDVAMPGTDGLTALPEIIARGDGAHVLIVSAIAEEGAEACLRALELGASDTLPKPTSLGGGFGGRFADLLADKLLRIGHAERGAKRIARRRQAEASFKLRPSVAGPIECLAIGASTGGLPALTAFLKALPPSFTAPILVTQHLPAPFMRFFAAQLRDLSGRPAAVAREGMQLRAGEILVAPGDAHLGLARSGGEVRVRLDQAPAPSACLPSVDPMLEAVARCFGAHGIAVILSGMGRDGAIGAAVVIAAGGEVLAQDAESAVIWGMPGAVATAGLASLVAAPGALAGHVRLRADIASGAGPWR
ncbi:MAG: chemotaxis-specific protein-glutamate methyltransferase CheB [Sphingomonadaceae bacterium]|nr:chemotaxis-specific protein-glutamate methyltransferase CheB [Sphingomonadaceae bacterium]